MSTNKDKGTAAERTVMYYLRRYWPAVERRALSGAKDKGDIIGVPNCVIEVKDHKTPRLAEWKREVIRARDNAMVTRCVLVVKRERKPVYAWDAYVPAWQMGIDVEPEEEQWVRMDLVMAVATLRPVSSLLPPSSPTTESTSPSADGETTASSCAPSTERPTPPSR